MIFSLSDLIFSILNTNHFRLIYYLRNGYMKKFARYLPGPAPGNSVIIVNRYPAINNQLVKINVSYGCFLAQVTHQEKEERHLKNILSFSYKHRSVMEVNSNIL